MRRPSTTSLNSWPRGPTAARCYWPSGRLWRATARSRPSPTSPWPTWSRYGPPPGSAGSAIGRNAVDEPLVLDGDEDNRGVGVHADSVLACGRKPGYRRFVGRVGIDDQQGWHGSIKVKAREARLALGRAGEGRRRRREGRAGRAG
jgi:hypothetical protein